MANDGNRDPFGTRIDKHYEYLKGKRTTWERQWQELAEYVLPHRSDFTSKRSLGEERLEMAFEGTAMRALKRFASQIHNVFTPNGDGINDYFDFGEFAMKDIDVSIYIRWVVIKSYIFIDVNNNQY